mmetsp:Transcript_24844/g.62486  ORF Transcript_24844/g.62486 Transcript_24844/m.62486 type:complete len:155 (-) Transcript_24844:302-766(-)
MAVMRRSSSSSSLSLCTGKQPPSLDCSLMAWDVSVTEGSTTLSIVMSVASSCSARNSGDASCTGPVQRAHPSVGQGALRHGVLSPSQLCGCLHVLRHGFRLPDVALPQQVRLPVRHQVCGVAVEERRAAQRHHLLTQPRGELLAEDTVHYGEAL